jgi:hypothetical protein
MYIIVPVLIENQSIVSKIATVWNSENISSISMKDITLYSIMKEKMQSKLHISK